MDISKSVARACESGRSAAAHIIDALDSLVDYMGLWFKAAEITVIWALVKGCSKVATALRNRAEYLLACIEEDERSEYGDCRR